jgi:hypothetical protein
VRDLRGDGVSALDCTYCGAATGRTQPQTVAVRERGPYAAQEKAAAEAVCASHEAIIARGGPSTFTDAEAAYRAEQGLGHT